TRWPRSMPRWGMSSSAIPRRRTSPRPRRGPEADAIGGTRGAGMAVTSAGLLLYRLTDAEPEVLVAHMGGPYWAAKDEGAWSIPKGEFDEGDEPALDAARREFREELGVDPPDGPYAELGTFAYSSG